MVHATGLQSDCWAGSQLVQDLLPRDLAAEGIEVHTAISSSTSNLIETTGIPRPSHKNQRHLSLLTVPAAMHLYLPTKLYLNKYLFHPFQILLHFQRRVPASGVIVSDVDGDLLACERFAPVRFHFQFRFDGAKTGLHEGVVVAFVARLMLWLMRARPAGRGTKCPRIDLPDRCGGSSQAAAGARR